MPDIILRKINERMIEAQLQELADKWNECSSDYSCKYLQTKEK